MTTLAAYAPVWMAGESVIGVLRGTTWLLRRINQSEPEAEAVRAIGPPSPTVEEKIEADALEASIERVKRNMHKAPLLKVERTILTKIGPDGKRRRDQSHAREARLLP